MTLTPEPLTWAVLGTANIARAQFLPALAEAGGRPAVVAGRDLTRAKAWADEHGVEAAVEGYEAALADPAVEAVYVALPNALHAEWTMKALQAGKHVLCEKPLTTSVEDTAWAVATAEETGGLLWEAFVFPFGSQWTRIASLLADGVIGAVQEIVSSFHFRVRREQDVRLSAALGGGCLADVGCYPLRLAQLTFDARAQHAQVSARHRGDVETDAAALVDFEGGGRLLLSCGFDRAYDTSTRIIGTDGWIDVDNPFHPSPSDSFTVVRPGAEPQREQAMTDRHSFTGAIRHVTAAVRGVEAPRHLASADSLRTAQALALAQART